MIKSVFSIRQTAKAYENDVLQEEGSELTHTMLSQPEDEIKELLKRSVDALCEGQDDLERIDDFTIKEIVSPTYHIISKWEIIEHSLVSSPELGNILLTR
jgi:hypothetical protein